MDAECGKCKLLSTSLQLRWIEGSSYYLTYLECGHESIVHFEGNDFRCLFEEGSVEYLVLYLKTDHPGQSNVKGFGDFAGIHGLVWSENDGGS
jgi:hypothetical protein